MRIIPLIFVLFCSVVFAQKNVAFDSLRLKEANDLFADDYGNIYLYKNKDFSFTKYDSLGNQKGRLMLTLPFRIQSVQNPLTIPSFSDNAQELKFFDQNLNLIQTINLRQKFGWIKEVYVEDLQRAWLLDESSKRLIQYNFRNDQILNSYPFETDYDALIDVLVFENKLYLLTKNSFSVFDFSGNKLLEIAENDGKRIRRENDTILIISKQSIQKLTDQSLKVIFSTENAKIVDKNSSSYFAILRNKLYLYPRKE